MNEPNKGRRFNLALRDRDRFWSKVQKTDTCWIWTGAALRGYGQFHLGTAATRRTLYAYRVAYELKVGPIAEGLELDHLCRNRACVNPDHLEPVTHTENMRRAFEAMKTCRRGHPRTEDNTRVVVQADGIQRRRCRECLRENDRARTRRRTTSAQP